MKMRYKFIASILAVLFLLSFSASFSKKNMTDEGKIIPGYAANYFSLINEIFHAKNGGLGLLLGMDKEDNDSLLTGPENVNDIARTVLIYLEMNDIEEAWNLLGDLPRVYPDNPFVANTAGLLLIKEGRYYKALMIMEDAVSSGKGNVELYRTLGNFYLSIGRYGDAKKIFQAMTRTKTGMVEGNIGIALCELGKGKIKNSEKIIKEWSRKLSRQSLCKLYENMVDIYMSVLDDMEKAKEYVDLFVKNCPPASPEKFIVMGNFMLNEGQLKEAGKYFDRALDVSKIKYLTHLDIARKYLDNGCTKEVAEHIKKAEAGIENLPGPLSAALFYRSALMLYYAGDYKGAIFYSEKSRNFDPYMSESQVLLSRLHRESGNIQAGENILDRLLRLEPDNNQAAFERDYPDKPNPYLFMPR